MRNAITADLYRIRKSKLIWLIPLVLLLLFGILVFLLKVMDSGVVDRWLLEQIAYSDAQGITSHTQEEIAEMEAGLQFALPADMDGAQFLHLVFSGEALALLLFLPFLLLLLLDEFSAGTLRNSIAADISRKKIFFSKCTTLFFSMLALRVVSLLTLCFAGGIGFGFSGFTASFFRLKLLGTLLHIPGQFALLGVGVLLAVLSKHSGFTVASYFVITLSWPILCRLFSHFFPMLRWVSHLNFLALLEGTGEFLLSASYPYLPGAVAATLIGAACLVAATIRFCKMDLS